MTVDDNGSEAFSALFINNIFTSFQLNDFVKNKIRVFGKDNSKALVNPHLFFLVFMSINTRNWVDSAQDRDYWRALVNTTLNLRVS